MNIYRLRVKLRVWGRRNESLQVKLWEGQNVVFIVLVKMEHYLPNLVHLNSTIRKECFGGMVAGQGNAVFLIADSVSGDWWMVTHLLSDHFRCAIFVTLKVAEEQLSKDWIEWLALFAIFAMVILLFQRGQKPGENE